MRSALLRGRISKFERRLDPDKFIRLRRPTIIRRDSIERLRHDGAWYVVLADETDVRVGRTYLPGSEPLSAAEGAYRVRD